MDMGGKRFAVLLCAEDSDYVKKMYGGYFGVFVRMLAEEGETWQMYRVAGGEFPEDEEIGLFDGFVITGSCNDAHGNDVWICKLLNLLKKLDSMKKKVLGICFGHQVILILFLFFIVTLLIPAISGFVSLLLRALNYSIFYTSVAGCHTAYPSTRAVSLTISKVFFPF